MFGEIVQSKLSGNQLNSRFQSIETKIPSWPVPKIPHETVKDNSTDEIAVDDMKVWMVERFKLEYKIIMHNEITPGSTPIVYIHK